MSYDPDSISDRRDNEEPKGCPRCKGTGVVSWERGNPRAVSPCGCDEPDEDEFAAPLALAEAEA